MMKPAESLLSRRKAVAALTVGVVTSGAFAATRLSLAVDSSTTSKTSLWDRQSVDLATAGSSDWAAQVGSLFTLTSEKGDLKVKLASVTNFPNVGTRPAGLRAQAFALNFTPTSGALPAGDRIYTLNHQTGVLKVFFSDTDKILLAVFN